MTLYVLIALLLDDQLTFSFFPHELDFGVIAVTEDDFLMFSVLISVIVLFFFFFSSRRRHTRFDCDWSSDVCSSDLINTADFENPEAAAKRLKGKYSEWNLLIDRLERHLQGKGVQYPIDEFRRRISNQCRESASRAKGIYTLTVPTGGGKTLASLRFALHHAKTWEMDRVIYLIPFTSIIDQNADVVRRILEPSEDGVEQGSVVLEHHSNITPEEQTWKSKILSENWDAP